MALTQLKAQFLLIFLAGLASGSAPRRIGERLLTTRRR